jgi:hypothetical protein
MGILVWPAVVLIIAIMFLLVYRQPVTRLVDRTKKITTAGLDASAAAQETSIERKQSGAEEMLARFENELLLDRENLIRQELTLRHVDAPADRERVLIRHLAAALIYNHFDRTYRWIFGSQLLLLQQLNAAPSTRTAVGIHYQIAALESPEFYFNYSFDQWLHFMVSQVLVRADGEAISITVGGREFLKFVVEEGLSFNKNG